MFFEALALSVPACLFAGYVVVRSVGWGSGLELFLFI